jgi:hypothetical protein
MFTFKSVKMCWNIKKTGEKKKKKRGGNQDKEGKPSRDIRAQGPVLNYCTGESSHTHQRLLSFFILFLPSFHVTQKENFYCGYPGMKEEKIPFLLALDSM